MAAETKSAEAKAEAKSIESKSAEIKFAEIKVAEPKVAESKQKPASKRPNAYPSEGFALEIDGKVKSEHDSLETAQERGLALKTKYPVLQVVVYDAVNKTRTVLELPA
jgi:hypothetical protein